MEALYDWIKGIVYFLIFVTLLKNLIGKGYQKYASVLFGLCLVLQIAEPLSWFGEESRLDLQAGLRTLAVYEEEVGWFVENTEQGVLAEKITEEAKQLLWQQVEQLVTADGYELLELKLHWETAEAAEADFGTELSGQVITGFTIWLNDTTCVEQERRYASQAVVETVSITDIVIELEREHGQKENIPEQANDSPAELAVKKKLADFYDMEESHINVIIPMGNNS